MNDLRSGVFKADEKGIRESLVIVDSLAFIVNVPNRTVVTAMDRTESNDNIYTNIDGAVIMQPDRNGGQIPGMTEGKAAQKKLGGQFQP